MAVLFYTVCSVNGKNRDFSFIGSDPPLPGAVVVCCSSSLRCAQLMSIFCQMPQFVFNFCPVLSEATCFSLAYESSWLHTCCCVAVVASHKKHRQLVDYCGNNRVFNAKHFHPNMLLYQQKGKKIQFSAGLLCVNGSYV